MIKYTDIKAKTFFKCFLKGNNMSDSDKTNELDNYGVWVKKPPRTVSSEINMDNIDVVDNSAFDSGETALSQDELANIAGMSSESPSPSSSGETEEISLDEFIEGGVFEGDEENSAPATTETAAESTTETVSADDFLDSRDITVSDAPSVSEPASFVDDGPLDIDLSFDDTAPAAPSSQPGSAPVAEVPGTEEVDLSDFGLDFGDDSSSSSGSPASDDGTESVDLSDFGVDFGDDSSAPSTEAAPQESAAEPKINDDGTEEISLDSFGFDINAEEKPAEESETAESGETQEESSPSITEEAPSLSEEAEGISLSAEDDVGDISLDSEAAPQEETEKVSSQSFGEQDADDFDLDSIMDSIEDENGNKSSLINSEPVFEESPAPTEETPSDINVVDMDEPVFEETSVDIQEAAPEEDSFEIPDAESFNANPTESSEETSPADDGTVVDDISLNDIPAEEASVSEEEPAFEDYPAAEESPVIEESPAFETETPVEKSPVFEEPVIEESPVDEAPVFDEAPVDKAPLIQESIAEENEIKSEPESVKQDAEISSAANSILSQIAAELSSLRSEISNLKTEFEELKNKEPAAPQVEEENIEVAPEEEPVAQTESSGGFFSDDDEDDTIALSLDEMDNIFNTVEMVEEEAPEQHPESDDALSEEPLISEEVTEPETSEEGESALDFSNDSIEEPVLDDIDTNIAGDEELPEEILVPKADDILVESSQENLIEEEPEINADLGSESVELSAENEGSVEDTTLVDEPFVFEESDTSASGAVTDEPAEFSEEAPAEEVPFEDFTESAPEAAEESGETLTEEENIEEENEDTGSVSITEGELSNLLSSEAALQESQRNEEEEDSTPVQSSIPNELQKEIKSVLSYMDQLLENLPEEKIAEFAQSEQFETYKKLFKELGLN